MSDPAQNTTAQDYMHKMNDALNEICDLVGMSQAWTDPDTIRRRVKDIRTERDAAHRRIKELEAKIAHDVANSAARDMRIKELEAKHATEIKASSTVNTSLMRQIKKAHEALDAAGIPRSAEEDGEPGSPWTLSQRIAVLLTPGDDESLTEWAISEIDKILHGEPVPFACDLDKLIGEVKTLHGDVAAVWELWGAGREVKPGALLEVCQEQEQHLSAAQGKLDVIAEKLDCAKVPAHYGRDQKGGPVPVPERVGLLIVSHASARALAESWETTANREAEERMEAHAVLDDLGSPAHAGPIFLDLPARILALPGLLRKD